MADYILTNDCELMHYGVKGMKWGVRRYQNVDGSLTAKGQKRLVKSIQKSARSRKAKKDMFDKTSDMLAEELERKGVFKNDVQKLRKLASNYTSLMNKEYKFKNEHEELDAVEKIEKAWNDYATERDRMVGSLVGKYADTPIKSVSRNTRQISDAKTIATAAVAKLSDPRYKNR